MRTTYLVCYDIAEDKRRERIFKLCKDRGEHVQFSVFECDLTAGELTLFRGALSEVIAAREDQILFVSLGPAESRGDRVITALGRPYARLDAPCFIA